MQLNNEEEFEQQLKDNEALRLNVNIFPVEDYYCLDFNANINEQYVNLFVNQTFILFVLELRSGMSQRAISVLRNCILDFCDEALEKNLTGLGFVINGQYYTIKKPNYQSIKQILTTYMTVSLQDNYISTLRKLRHILQKQIYKYDKNPQYIDMVFFTSYVEIDHSLGVKKRSYIDYLNEHSEDCRKEVDRIYDFLKKDMKRFNAHVIGLEKRGLKDQDYSLADRDLYNRIFCRLGSYQSMFLIYWIEEQDPSFYFQAQMTINRPASFTKLAEGFKTISSSVLSASLNFQLKVPMKQSYYNIVFSSSNTTKYEAQFDCFIKKDEISLDKLYNNQFKVSSKQIQKTLIEKNKLLENVKDVNELYKIRSSYTELSELPIGTQINYRSRFFNRELNEICQQLKNKIISFKRIYDGNNKSHLEMIVDQDKQQDLKNSIFYIEKQAKQIYEQIFDSKLFPAQTQAQCQAKRQAFQLYSSLKMMLDVSQQVLMNIFKRQIKNDEIGKISKATTFWTIKRSLKNKLIRRINLNPKMIDQTYSKIHQIVQKTDYTSLQTLNKSAKHAIGYCIKSGINFATALRKQDCLGVLIEIQRPDSAIADPGRIKIRQISPFAMSVSNFFKVYHYGIDDFGQLDQEKGGEWVREYAKLQKENFQEMWDYWALVEKKYTVTAIVPVYLCKQHWDVAKLLMKPCLGWTATGQPLGYTFSQFQTIPFMILSYAIRRVQQITYKIQQLETKIEKNEFKVTQYSILQRSILDNKLLKRRMQDLCWVLEQTCYQIMKDMSSGLFQQKLNQLVIQKYRNYVQNPIQRTIDVISNNSAFFAQLYCVIKLQMFQKPEQKQFHQFFKRLVEQELRRQTDGWNQEQTQDKFINKLLNCQVEKMDVPQYYVIDSEYFDKFEQLQKGEVVHKTYFEIKRNQLEMMVTKNGKFNDTQRMLLIQYKRLYENRVIWMWYLRFRLYQQIERIKIHKWLCIDLKNSYMLFTMIIQNKKQRKNYKRREAILQNQYVDPFNEQKARQFLQLEFMRLRASQQRQNIKILNNQKYGNAASTFVYSKSLEQAAGTLINFDIGQHCNIFFRQIERGQGIRLAQKLQMLLLGQFKNVRLFNGWKMSSKRTNKLRKIYPELYLKYGYMI